MTRSGTIRGLLAAAAISLLAAGCSAGTTSSDEADSDQARALAQQLQTALAAAGLEQPSTDVLTTLYGSDGGVSCENAGNFTHVDGLQLFGNVSLRRRVPLDPSVVAYDEAVVNTYCPDRLADLQKAVADQGTPGDHTRTIP